MPSRHNRKESERFKSFTYEELIKRDSRAERDSLPKAAQRVAPEGASNVNFDLFWLKVDSLQDIANLPDPGILAMEIAEDLEAALEQFATIAEDLKR